MFQVSYSAIIVHLITDTEENVPDFILVDHIIMHMMTHVNEGHSHI